MIEIRNVNQSYGSLLVLDGFSLTIGAGELIALLGTNGAGKSTLMQCILGITGFEGTITINGVDVARNGKRARALVGYMPQAGSLHADLTVAETMEFYSSVRGTPPQESRRLLAEVDLADVTDRKVGELSGGMRQRLSFAIARLGNPPAMLLDEPTSGLDRESRRIILERMRALASEGTALLVSTHLDHELSSIAGRFVEIEDGRLQTTREHLAAAGGEA